VKPAVHAIIRERARVCSKRRVIYFLHHRDFIESTEIAFLLTEMTPDIFWVYFQGLFE